MHVHYYYNNYPFWQYNCILLSQKDDGFVGTLFLPPGEGPFPAVINMYGGIYRGTVVEDRSAMLASRGIASLALAYFGVPGLPKSYIE